MAARVPTYVTIKDVKRRWGHGQEDVYPVAQFEKLWGDLSSLPDLPCAFLAVDRRRGQQLKDAAQLDGWANDGSMAARRVALPFQRARRFEQWPRAIWFWSRAARVSSARTWSRPCWPRASRARGGQPGHGPSVEPGRPRGPVRMARGRPARSAASADGRRRTRPCLPPGGDPQRPALGPRAARLARQRPDGDDQPAGGVATGRRPAVSSSPRRAAPTARRRSCPSTRRCCPSPLEPLRRGQARGRTLRGVYARTMGLDGVSLRYFNVFGPRQDPSSPYSGVISIFVDADVAAAGGR